MKKGIIFALLSYVLWGLFPIYWKQLLHVDSFQVIAHRIVWSLAFVLVVQIIRKGLGKSGSFTISFDQIKIYLLAGIFIGINWFLYVWAVNSGHIVDASLGYFINPLITVLFGLLFLKEPIKNVQWVALMLAFAGVAYLGFCTGGIPWISLVLAFSFSVYGLIKKKGKLDPFQGLMVETAALTLPSLIYLGRCQINGMAAFGNLDAKTSALLAGGGIITTLPLVFFAAASQKIPLSLIGILQFLSPTLQLICGIFIYNEPFQKPQQIAFLLVWLGVIIFLYSRLNTPKKPG